MSIGEYMEILEDEVLDPACSEMDGKGFEALCGEIIRTMRDDYDVDVRRLI